MQNLTRIEIENFQSIEFVSIPLASTGLHWINGKPNVGKSAVLKAIQALFTNVNNLRYKEMIRDGQDAFRVKGYFGEDDWVELIRGENDSYSWVLDGRAGRVERTQGKVPFEVNQYYQLYWTGDRIKRHLNFTLVGDPLFFVETTQGENTTILERALGTDRLTRVSKYADTERREVRSELRTIRKFHEESESKLETLMKQVDEGEDRLYILDRLEKTIESEIEVFNKVDNLLTNTQQLVSVAHVVQTVENMLNGIDTKNLESEIGEYKKVSRLYDKKLHRSQLEKEREDIEITVTKSDIKNLEKDISEYRKVDRLYNLSNRKALLDEEQEALKVTVTREQLKDLEDEINQYDRVLLLMTKLKDAHLGVEQYQKDLAEAETEYKELNEKKEEFLSQFEVCPFCERPMDAHGGC